VNKGGKEPNDQEGKTKQKEREKEVLKGFLTGRIGSRGGKGEVLRLLKKKGVTGALVKRKCGRFAGLQARAARKMT